MPDASVVNIRLADAGDATAIAELNTVLGYPSPAESIPGRLARFAAVPNGIAFVAEVDARVVGVITAQLIPSIHDDAPVAWITTLVVLTDMQGKGVGRTLVRAAEQWAVDGGAVRIAVTSRTHRIEAHKFYEGLDYGKTGVRLGRPLR